MKKILFTVFAALSLFAASSCTGNGDEAGKTEIGTEFTGTLTCSVMGKDYPSEGIRVSVDKDDAAGNVIITMYKVRFVPQMPVEMTFNLGPVAFTSAKDGGIVFSSADNLIPYNELVSYESYAVSGFTGTVSSGKISLSMTFATPMGAAPTTYEGTAGI